MNVLVANLGSTSFKYKLFCMDEEEQVLASGTADRIGQGASHWAVDADGRHLNGTCDLSDHAAAIELHLQKMLELGAISGIEEVEAIGFKAVHGGPISGAVQVDDRVLSMMQRMVPLAPQHNPPYIEAMKSFRQKLPEVAQVAAFETAFHASIPLRRQVYAVPYDWIDHYGIRRYGFHGASNAYIAARMAQLEPNCPKLINLHLGGSCSICAIESGASVAHSMGTSAQTGVFHANRVGDFDPFSLIALREQGLGIDEALTQLSVGGGLLGLSGISADLREIEVAASSGNTRAQLAIDAFIESCRHYVCAYLGVLNGADAIVFTGGIGLNARAIRSAILHNLDYAKIRIDPQKNQEADPNQETRIDAATSGVQIWIVPTNEELVVARQTVQLLSKQAA